MPNVSLLTPGCHEPSKTTVRQGIKLRKGSSCSGLKATQRARVEPALIMNGNAEQAEAAKPGHVDARHLQEPTLTGQMSQGRDRALNHNAPVMPMSKHVKVGP